MKSISEYIKQQNSIRLLAVGDITAHDCILNDLKFNGIYNFTPIFKHVKPIIQQSDIAFCNQESIIAGNYINISGGEKTKVYNSGVESPLKNPVFCSPYEFGEAVLDCGFNLISLANNHTLDKGINGVDCSLNYWKSKSVITAGSYSSFYDRDNICVHECKGIKYAFLSYTTKKNDLLLPDSNKHYSNLYDPELVKKNILSIRKDVDLIIVSMHWGKEYNAGKQNREQKEIANYLSSLGVDIILGHHPHVLQPYERIDNTLVFYSLGNFLSYQNSNDINRKVGVIMSLNITKNKNKIHISEPTFELIYCYKNDSNYEIIPFSIMNNTILNNYKTIQKDQLSYLL